MKTLHQYIINVVILSVIIFVVISCGTETGEAIRSSDDVPYDIVLEGGNFYVVGYDTVEGDARWRIEKRVVTTGLLMESFGTAGVATSNISTGFDVAKAIELDASGIYIVGGDETLGAGNAQMRVEKRNKDTGSIVDSFFTDGTYIWNASDSDDISETIILQVDRITIMSNTHRGDSDSRLYYTKVQTDGQAGDAYMGLNLYPSAVETVYDAIPHLSETRYSFVVGSEASSSDLNWLIIQADQYNGVEQYTSTNPSGNDDEALALAGDGTNLYIAGYDMGNGTKQWRIQKHVMSDLSIVSGFGTSGVVTSVSGEATGIAADSTYIYVVGNDDSTSERMWRIEKRTMDTGALVSAFGSNGVVQSNPSTGIDGVTAVAVDSNNLYIVGWKMENGYKRWHIEIRDKIIGAL